MNKNSFSLNLRTDRPRSKGFYPLVVNLSIGGDRHQITTDITLSKDQWEKVLTPGQIRQENFMLRERIVNLETKARNFINTHSSFTYKEFRKSLLQDYEDYELNIYRYGQEYIDQLEEDGRINTAQPIQDTLSLIKRFVGHDKPVLLSDITIEWMKSFEKFYRLQGKASSTIGKHGRNIRTLYRLGLEEGVISMKSYPFGKGKYVIPQTRANKRALNALTLKRIFAHTSSD